MLGGTTNGERMNGQWIGTYSGTTEGTITVNIDDRKTHYEGVAYLIEKDPTLPNSAAFFRTPNKDPKAKIKTDEILVIDSQTGSLFKWDDNFKKLFPNVATFSKE